MTSDGSIFVTGEVSGWSANLFATLTGSYTQTEDCFLLKLDSHLNLVYARSVGSRLKDSCTSIQVTRNADYIYLAGNTDYSVTGSIFIMKLDGLGLIVYYATLLKPNVGGATMSMRRIMLSNERNVFGAWPNGNALGDKDINQKVYFCGQFTSGTGDFLFG